MTVGKPSREENAQISGPFPFGYGCGGLFANYHTHCVLAFCPIKGDRNSSEPCTCEGVDYFFPLYALELTLEEIPFGDYLKGEQSHTRESERCGQSTRQDSSDHARVPASSRSGAIREAVVSENPFTGTTVWQLESQQ